MGLAVRIIPTLLKRGEQLVKGRQFNAWRSVGVVEQAARICGTRGVDEVILLDIDATPSGRGPDFEFIARVADNFFTPLTVGGGVRSIEDVKQLLAAGADKVAIGTAAYNNPVLVNDCAVRFGRQAIVVAVDARNNRLHTHCGRLQRMAAAEQWAKTVAQWGAGEILLTSIEREGMMQGYDLELVRAVSHAVDIPVIAHGGCSGYPDMLAAIEAGASAVAAGALFQFTAATPQGAAQWLAQAGVETRIPA